MAKTIYMDHAATTPVGPSVVQKMLPYFTESKGKTAAMRATAAAKRAAGRRVFLFITIIIFVNLQTPYV